MQCTIELDGELNGIQGILEDVEKYRQVLEEKEVTNARDSDTIAHIILCLDNLQFVLDNIKSRTIPNPTLWELDKEMLCVTSKNLLRSIKHHYPPFN